MANLVKFSTGTAAEYAALATKDANTLYFVTDTKKLYKGDVAYGATDFLPVANFPATPEIGAIYVNTTTGEVAFYNGADYVTIVKPSPAGMAATPDADTLATQKAVADYVAAEIAKLDAGSIAADIEDIKDTLAIKADAATTLAGYGITDAYTKTETDTAIATAVNDANHIKNQIVTELPEIEDADENVIYLVPKTDAEGNQNYDEFMVISDAFEKIGDTAVNLSGYATSEDLQDKYDELKDADAANLQVATDYADSLADNYATAAQGEKADTAVQPEDITEGATNGTIAVGETEVAVHGLGSAAYTEASDYDAAGAATTALNDAKTYTNEEIEKALTWQPIGA